MRRIAMNRRHGFTLVEMLIVIVVIAILALLVLPRIMGASRRAKESTLRANLWSIREGVNQYQADTGVYPAQLVDLLIDPRVGDAEPTEGIDDEGNTMGIPSGTYNGPYFSTQGGLDSSGMPVNPFGPSGTGNIDTDVTDHWRYENGEVFCAIDGATISGVNYSDL